RGICRRTMLGISESCRFRRLARSSCAMIRLPKDPLFAKQGVHICGFGSETFMQAVNSIYFIHEKMREHHATLIQDYEVNEHRGYPVIAASNRFFTVQNDAVHEGLTSFPPDVDPFGVLNKMSRQGKKDLVRTDEND